MPISRRQALGWAGALTASLYASVARAGGLKAGAAAPGLKVKLLDGRAFDLQALKGKVVLLNFWATWCPPCRAEMPMLDAFYRQHHGEGLELLGLSQDKPRDRTKVVEIATPLAYPCALLDDAKIDGFGPFRILPATVVVDRTGFVRTVMASGEAATVQSLASTVAPLLRAR